MAAPELAELSPPDGAEAEVAAGGGAATVVAGGGAAAVEAGGGGAVAAPLEPDDGVPGESVISVSWLPSVMGPEGLAGQDPGGERGVVKPKGMVPAAPTASPPTNVVWSSPWNWHWKKPLSSAFFGADSQYGTACEVGWNPIRGGQGRRSIIHRIAS